MTRTAAVTGTPDPSTDRRAPDASAAHPTGADGAAATAGRAVATAIAPVSGSASPSPAASRPKPVTERQFHKDFLLTCSALATEDGRFQARVVITALGGTRTRSQRFLDLGCMPTEAAAMAHALQSGISWVDQLP